MASAARAGSCGTVKKGGLEVFEAVEAQMTKEEKKAEIQRALLEERLDKLRKIEKELTEDSWRYEAPRHMGWMCSN